MKAVASKSDAARITVQQVGQEAHGAIFLHCCRLHHWDGNITQQLRCYTFANSQVWVLHMAGLGKQVTHSSETLMLPIH